MKFQKINKMKKIMFNDKFILTQAVLRGEKTQTRRIVKDGTPLGDFEEAMKHAPYKVGEVVAVAQSYKAIYDELEEKDGNCVANEWWCDAWDIAGGNIDISAGYTNKMFVKAELMPHKVRITNVCIERLQDISDEDCLCEGIFHCTPADAPQYINIIRGWRGMGGRSPCQSLAQSCRWGFPTRRYLLPIFAMY